MSFFDRPLEALCGGMPGIRKIKLGLLVTGEGERLQLQRLFRSLKRDFPENITVTVVKNIKQHSPRSGKKHQARLKALGTNKYVSTQDEAIGLAALGYLKNGDDHFTVLIDDLEGGRVAQAAQVFDRYTAGLHAVVPSGMWPRASVHFLCNMLEAYFLADIDAVNTAFGVLLHNYQGDVETVSHPKNELKRMLAPAGINYKETEHVGKVLQQLNWDTVLADPATCPSLRTLFAWVCHALGAVPLDGQGGAARYRLNCGVFFPITGPQLETVLSCYGT